MSSPAASTLSPAAVTATFPPTPTPTPHPPSPAAVIAPKDPIMATEEDTDGLSTGTLNGIIVGVVLGSVGMVIVGVIFVFLYRRARRSGNSYIGAPPPRKADKVLANHQLPSSPEISLSLAQSTFTYDELATATDGFSDSNLLGQGGFGYVHKGVLPDGKTVAVKQLKSESRQGEREFHAEVEVISRVHHRHLVSLVGYCVTDSQRVLVYEFVPNSTLEFHLYGKDRPTLEWSTRIKIAIGSAKGLTYLHEDCQPKIIHRDIKASNILIDENFEAKVADFGLAKFSSDAETHVSTRVMGTFGYMAPEYAASGRLTEKSDVFSYGVVLLELITGRKPVDNTGSFTDDSMVEWARPLLSDALENGNLAGLADPRLHANYDPDEMVRMIACAATCVRYSARLRPQMSQVVRALEGNLSLDALYEGGTPGHSGDFGSFGSSNFDSSQYSEDLKNFRKPALESREQGAGEYSGPSSEDRRHQSASTSSGLQNTPEIEMGNVKGSSTGSNHGSGVSS